MHRRLAPFVPFVLLLGACGSGEDPAVGAGESTTSAAAAEDGPQLQAVLSGAEAVPGPGDADGAGSATVRLVPARSEVCFTIEVEGVDAPTGAHLHRAPKGQAGDVVLDLSALDGCAAANEVLLAELEADPSSFYVNVHNEAFPQGAVRGQLS